MKIIDFNLLKEFRNEPCELCGKAAPSEPHHLFCRGMGGGNRLDVRLNLISLCRRCHGEVQGKQDRLPELCFLVVRREAWRLRRLPKDVAIEAE